MACRIEYKSSVAHDLQNLDKAVAKRVINELEGKLSRNPDCGEALTGQFKGLFKLRIGEYRVVYSKKQGGVLVLRIRNRSNVYR
ncbi:MAG: type II toxin-antitoxin system RelE/ParE family toxin [Methanothrix sp.]|nr:type II toxin-antitoxin system RelE/ParE family toxin [Methanothrix sp.]